MSAIPYTTLSNNISHHIHLGLFSWLMQVFYNNVKLTIYLRKKSTLTLKINQKYMELLPYMGNEDFKGSQ